MLLYHLHRNCVHPRHQEKKDEGQVSRDRFQPSTSSLEKKTLLAHHSHFGYKSSAIEQICLQTNRAKIGDFLFVDFYINLVKSHFYP